MDGEKVVGVLPIVFLKSKLFGKILSSMPFLNFGGVLGDNCEIEDFLIKEARNLLKQNEANYFEFRHTHKIASLNHTQEHKVSMRVELQSDPEILWNGFHTKHRTAVRKALNQNFSIQRGTENLLKDFYPLICRGWRDLGTPLYNISFFENIVTQLSNNFEIYVVYDDKKSIATAFNGLLNDSVEGMWTYALPEYRHKNLNYYLYWEMIRQSCIRGYRYFHLGRSSKDSGAVFFKKKWNAVPQQLYWQYLLPENTRPPQLNVDNPKYRLAINIWKRLPIWLTRVIGPPIAKNIP
jgi:FemAB-related protein (PEP-CTERM system-associated)